MTRRESRTLELGGPVHFVDCGGPDAGPAGGDPATMILVHGLGGSHADWWSLGPLLAQRNRVLAVDLPGFGRTPPIRAVPRIRDFAAFVAEFVRHVADGPVTLVGNSMGGGVALHVAAGDDGLVSRLILLDPIVPQPWGCMPEFAVWRNFAICLAPGIAERLLQRQPHRVSPESMVDETLRVCCADPSRVDAEHREALVSYARERAEMSYGDRTLVETTRSVVFAILARSRFRRVISDVAVPTLLVHGSDDPLVTIRTAEATARSRLDWDTVILDGVGHVPQIEVPHTTAELIDRWLSGTEAVSSGRRA